MAVRTEGQPEDMMSLTPNSYTGIIIASGTFQCNTDNEYKQDTYEPLSMLLFLMQHINKQLLPSLCFLNLQPSAQH